MYRLLVAIIMATVLGGTTARAEECSAERYKALVLEARAADQGRQWEKSVELYKTMFSDCRELLTGTDLVKAYDALAVGQLMTGNPSAAIDTAANCQKLDAKYNACLMTAAQASYDLGDKDRAAGFAREAIEIGVHDEYSNAVVIAARYFLRKIGSN